MDWRAGVLRNNRGDRWNRLFALARHGLESRADAPPVWTQEPDWMRKENKGDDDA